MRATAVRERFERPSVERILEAAERVFGERGYGETSLRQIIAAAGVSTTAFYARFPSKEAVLEALVKRLLERLVAEAGAGLAEARSIEEGFERGPEVVVRVLGEHRVVVRLALTEAGSNAACAGSLREVYATLAALVRGRLERLVERGEVEVGDADALAWALVGALQIHVLRWAVFDELDGAGLANALRATARTVLPAIAKKRRRK